MFSKKSSFVTKRFCMFLHVSIVLVTNIAVYCLYLFKAKNKKKKNRKHIATEINISSVYFVIQCKTTFS